MTVLKSWGGGRVEEGWIHKDVRGTNPSARMQEITDEIAGPPSLRKRRQSRVSTVNIFKHTKDHPVAGSRAECLLRTANGQKKERLRF